MNRRQKRIEYEKATGTYTAFSPVNWYVIEDTSGIKLIPAALAVSQASVVWEAHSATVRITPCPAYYTINQEVDTACFRMR